MLSTKASRHGGSFPILRVCLAWFFLLFAISPLQAQIGRVHFHRKRPTQQTASERNGRPHLLEVAYGAYDQQPIVGAHVYLFSPGMGGPNTGAISLLDTTNPAVSIDGKGNGYVVTDSNGNFSIGGLYAMNCPTSTAQAYLVATGGSSGGTVNNTYTVELAAMPVPCSQMPDICCVGISEATTAAAAFALAAFADTSDDGLSTSSGSLSAIDQAWAYANSLASGYNGFPVNAGNSSPPPQQYYDIDTVADILAFCTNSNGTQSSNCSDLMSAATVTGQTAPADTWQAALSIVENPTWNVTNLDYLPPPQVPYQPQFSTPPSSWNLVVSGAPTITSLSPSSAGPGQAVTIYGANLSSSVLVDVGGVDAPVVSSGSGWVQVVVPTAAISGVIQVYSTSQASNPQPFKVLFPTTTTVAVNPNPSTYGNTVTVSGTVSSGFQGLVPTGQVICTANTSASPYTATLSSGAFSFPVSGLPSGTNTISCSYQGDGTYAPSVGTINAAVNAGGLTVSVVLSSSENPSVYGDVVFFSVIVTPSSGSTTPPTGTLSFYDGSTLLTTVPLSAGLYQTAGLTIGTHNITAQYSGDSNYPGTPSNTVGQIVTGQTGVCQGP